MRRCNIRLAYLGYETYRGGIRSTVIMQGLSGEDGDRPLNNFSLYQYSIQFCKVIKNNVSSVTILDQRQLRGPTSSAKS